MGGGFGGCAGGYGAVRANPMQQNAMAMASPYGQAAGGDQSFASAVPASPVEVEEFLIMNPVEPKAQEQLRAMDPRAQRIVLDRGSLAGARDPTASLIGRMVKLSRLLNGVDGGMAQQFQQAVPTGATQQAVPATPEEVEQFLILNPVEQHAQDKFRGMNPQAQRWVINRGSLNNAKDSTGAFIGRMVQVEKVTNGQVQIPPGDWICQNCGDHQFARNTSCRSCGAPKSMSQSFGIVLNAL